MPSRRESIQLKDELHVSTKTVDKFVDDTLLTPQQEFQVGNTSDVVVIASSLLLGG